jgi:hypothetical protein
VVESQPSKLLVAGSIPVSRSNLRSRGERWLASQPSLTIAEQRADAWAMRQRGSRLVELWARYREEGRLADMSAVAPKARRPM